ncbi:MAG: hypothetical protein JWP06_277 [Candidatus Saccharibacteria bacterium]|nr:hypothetical protein [Candidatus Saccharibacteria bacterium]
MSDRFEWTTDRQGRTQHALVITLDQPCVNVDDLGEQNSAVPPVKLSDGLKVTYEIVPDVDVIDGDVLRNERHPETGRVQLDRGPLTQGKISLLTDLGYLHS